MLGSCISRVADPFGGAVDIIVVQQEDGTFKSSPWRMKFGKVQGDLERREKIVNIAVNDVQTDCCMYLDPNGEACFEKEVESDNEDTMLSPPSAPSSGDEIVEYERRKGRGCNLESVRVQEGLEMRDARKTEAVAGVAHDVNNPDSAMTDERNSKQVDSDPTVWVSSALVNQGKSEAVLAISETGSYLVDGNCPGTVNGSKAILEREERSERLGQAVPTPSRSIWGKSQHVSGGPSSVGHGGKQVVVDDLKRVSLERAGIVLDLLDRWGTGGKETSLTPTNKVQITASATATHVGSEGPQSTEKGSLMHGSESSVVMDETSSRQPAHQGYSVQEISEVDSERHGQEDMNREKRIVEDLEVSIVRSETSTQNRDNGEAIVEEDWFLGISVEEQTLVLLFQGSVGDGSLPPFLPTTEDCGMKKVSRSVKWHFSQPHLACLKLVKPTNFLMPCGVMCPGVEISMCRHLLFEGMGAEAAAKVFTSQKVYSEEFKRSGSAIVSDDKLVVKIGERYFTWVEAARYILGEVTYEMEGGIAVEAIDFAKGAKHETGALVPSPGGWSLWPFTFGRSRDEKVALSSSSVSEKALLAAPKAAVQSPFTEELLQKKGNFRPPWKSKVRTYVPTSVQLASLKLKEGPNKVTFTFSTRVLRKQQVDARIYLWRWNTRIVVSDVDGTITRSDVLGQVMALVGRDWSQSGVTRLFSAIKDNGYEVLFLSARAISQACLTRRFLLNLKQLYERLPMSSRYLVLRESGNFSHQM